MRWLDNIVDLMDLNLSKLLEITKGRKAWHAAVRGVRRVGHNLATEHTHTTSDERHLPSCDSPKEAVVKRSSLV